MAFQNNAFQRNAVQIGGTAKPSIQLLGGGADVSKEWLKKHGFQYPYQELKNKEYKARLQNLEDKLSDAELQKRNLQQKLEAAEKKKAQEKYKKQLDKLAALEAQAQEEIRSLLEEHRLLIRRIQDEEDSLILIYSLPFIH